MKNEPIRLQKYLSECGFCSRRKAEEFIERGKVKVNGHPAHIGDKVRPKGDIVTIGGKSKIAVRLDMLGCACADMPVGYVEPVASKR